MNTTTHLTGENKEEHASLLLNSYKKEYAGFIDLAAHELDAPLRKLSSFIEMLTNKFKINPADTEAKKYIERIDNCLTDMRSLINDLSMLSKIISEKKEYSSFNLDGAVQRALYELQPMINERAATIAVPVLPVVEGDYSQFVLLFKNILENGIKFSKKNMTPDIVISVSAINEQEQSYFHLSEDRKYFKIEIRDNGIGFKQEYAEKIFQPFVRLHGKSEYKGSGIGLAVCKKIVEQHGGILYAKGDENSGSGFIFILPQSINHAC